MPEKGSSLLVYRLDFFDDFNVCLFVNLSFDVVFDLDLFAFV